MVDIGLLVVVPEVRVVPLLLPDLLKVVVQEDLMLVEEMVCRVELVLEHPIEVEMELVVAVAVLVLIRQPLTLVLDLVVLDLS